MILMAVAASIPCATWSRRAPGQVGLGSRQPAGFRWCVRQVIGLQVGQHGGIGERGRPEVRVADDRGQRDPGSLIELRRHAAPPTSAD